MQTPEDPTIDRRTCLAAGVPAALALGLTQARADGSAGQLFAAIRRGKLKPGTAEEFARRVEAGALPVMRQMEGFRGYLLVMDAENAAIAISLFSNRTVAEGSTAQLMPWIKENLGPLLASPTEAIDGTVVISAL